MRILLLLSRRVQILRLLANSQDEAGLAQPVAHAMAHIALQRDALRATNGEFGWTRARIPLVVDILRQDGLGILGGELWWVRDGIPDWVGVIPQQHGVPTVYSWETKRLPGEPWPKFMERAAADSLAAVECWPELRDLPPDLAGRVVYNLSWVSEAEYQNLRTTAI